MTKQMPNIISVLRIALSVALLFIFPLKAAFYTIYLLCGVSDIIDGIIARKIHAESSLGAVLDSIGDIAFCAAVLAVLLPVMRIPTLFFFWIACIAAVKFASAAVGYFRYRKAAFLHTYLNKLTGMILFTMPLLYREIHMDWLLITACCVASFASAEELIINLTAKSLNRNPKGLFIKTTEKER